MKKKKAKSPALKEGDYRDAIEQIGRYHRKVPRFYISNLLNVATDGINFKNAPTGVSDEKDFMNWRRAPKHDVEGIMKKGVYGLLGRKTLLNIIKNFVFFEEKKRGIQKIIPRYQQFYATNKIVDRVKRGENKRGLIWHFQGSGKSYVMMFAAWKLRFHPEIENPQIFLVVDRNKLEGQILGKLEDVEFPNLENASSIENLENMIETDQRKVIVTTIHKFQGTGENLNEYENVVILADEAHRSEEKTLGMEMRSALPNAYFFGFTGTPIKKDYRNTYRSFGPRDSDEPYLDKYSMKRGREDDVILPIHYERRLPEWSIWGEKLDKKFKERLGKVSKEKRAKILREEIDTKKVVKVEKRIEKIAEDITKHYKENIEPNGFKGMVVTIDKEAAALYKRELDKHMNKGESAVVVSKSESDSELVKKYRSEKDQEDLVEDFKDEDSPLKILIVCKMLLTGFDAEILKVMYLDKQRYGHNLIQTIARTNRPSPHKNNGLIVDYFGVFSNWDIAVGDFKESEIRGAASNIDKLKDKFEETLQNLLNLFEEVEKEDREAWKKAVDILESNEDKRETFEEEIGRLKDLYESIAPDPFLKQYKTEYRWLCEINICYKKKVKRGEKPEEEEFGEKTTELVEKSVDVEGINSDFPLYEVDQDYLSKIEEKYPEPKERASEIEHALRDKIHLERSKNPRYDSLAERLEKIINRRREGDLDDIEALDKLEDLTEEAVGISASSMAEQKDLESGEYAIYELLKQYTEGEEGVIKEFARKTGAEVKEITSEFPNWEEKTETRREIKKQIKLICYEEYPDFNLYGSGFADEALGYIIEHYGG